MIDKNRGIIKRTTAGGIAVVMYKDQPGVYLTSTGEPLDEKFAVEAGFDVKTNRLERRRRELLAEAQERIDQQLREETHKVDEQLREEETSFESREGAPYVAEKRGRSWYVLDQKGEVIESKLASREEADEVIAGLVQEEQQQAATS